MHTQTTPPRRDMRGGNLCIGIDRALDHIENRFAEKLYLEELAALAGLSVCRFVRVFHRQLGIPPHRYVCHLSRHFKTLCGLTHYQSLVEGMLERNIGIHNYFSYIVLKTPIQKPEYPLGSLFDTQSAPHRRRI